MSPKNGLTLWNQDWKAEYNLNITSPLQYGNDIYISSIKIGTGLISFKDNIPYLKWTNNTYDTHQADPIIIGDFVYSHSGSSKLNDTDFYCIDVRNGEIKWNTKDIGNGTIIKVNGYLLSLSYKGSLSLIDPNPVEFNLIATISNIIPDVRHQSWVKPIVANENIYLRHRQRLISYSLKK